MRMTRTAAAAAAAGAITQEQDQHEDNDVNNNNNEEEEEEEEGVAVHADVKSSSSPFASIASWCLEALLDSSVPQNVLDQFVAYAPRAVKERDEKQHGRDLQEWEEVPRTTINTLRALFRKLDKYAKNGELDVSTAKEEMVNEGGEKKTMTNAEAAVGVLCDIDVVARKLCNESMAGAEMSVAPPVATSLKLAPTKNLMVEVSTCAMLSYVRMEEEGAQSAKGLENCVAAAARVRAKFASSSGVSANELNERADAIVAAAEEQKKTLEKKRLSSVVFGAEAVPQSSFDEKMHVYSAAFASEKLREYLHTSVQIIGASFLHRVHLEMQMRTFPMPEAPACMEVLRTATIPTQEEKEPVPLPAEAATLRDSRLNLQEASRRMEDPLQASLAIASTAAPADTPSKRTRAAAAEAAESEPPAVDVENVPPPMLSSDAIETASPIVVAGVDAVKVPVLPKSLGADDNDAQTATVWVNKGRSTTKRARGRGGRMWTTREESVLIEVVQKEMLMYQKLGRSRMPWKTVVAVAGNRLDNRTEVDCKDKWRNLVKAKKVKT